MHRLIVEERQCQVTNENEIYKLNAIEERICSAKMHMIAMLMRKLMRNKHQKTNTHTHTGKE